MYDQVLPTIGADIALTKRGVAATAADIIGSLDQLSGLKISVNKVDTTPANSKTGMSRSTPTYKVWGEASITVFKTNDNYKKIFNQMLGYGTSEADFECDLTLILPKRADWTDVPEGIVLSGFLSGLDWGTISKDAIQNIPFNFQPSGDVGVFNGFISITGITANPTDLLDEGGNVTFTVAGTGLINMLLVKGFLGGIAQAVTIGYTAGSATSQTVIVNYPANNDIADKVYTVKVSRDGGLTYDAETCTVTVAGV